MCVHTPQASTDEEQVEPPVGEPEQDATRMHTLSSRTESLFAGYCCEMYSDTLWLCCPRTKTIWMPEATEYCARCSEPLQDRFKQPLLRYLAMCPALPSPNQVRGLGQGPNLYVVLPKVGGATLKEYWRSVLQAPRCIQEQIPDCFEELAMLAEYPNLGSCCSALRAQLELVVPEVHLSQESWGNLVAYSPPSSNALLGKKEELTPKQKQALRATQDLLVYASAYKGDNPLIQFRRLSLWSGCLFSLLCSADDFVPAAIQGLLQHNPMGDSQCENSTSDSTSDTEQCSGDFVRRVLWCADCAQAVYNTVNLSTTPPAILAAWLEYDCKLAKLKEIPGDLGGWQIDCNAE